MRRLQAAQPAQSHGHLPSAPIRPFSSSGPRPQPSPVAPSSDALVQLAQNRRSIYKLGKTSPVPDSKVEELINAAILNVPSAFNTQSTRLVVLLHAEHERLWDIAIDAFGMLVQTGAVPEELWKNQTLPKLRGFQNAVGTVGVPRFPRNSPTSIK